MVRGVPPWLRVAIIAGVVLAAALGEPGPGTSGDALGVLVCLVVALLGGVGWAFGSTDRVVPPALAAIAISGAVLTALAPNTAGLALAFIALVATGALLPAEGAMAVAAAAILALAATTLLVGDGSVPSVLAYAAGYVASALSAGNRRESLLRLEQAEVLLARAQRSREEQVRAAALEERARIARDIHDVLAHSLAGLAVQLEATRALVAAGAGRAPVLERLERARSLTRDGLDEARQAVGTLRGDPVSLADRLEVLLATHRDAADAPVEVRIDGDPARATPDVSRAVLRTVQEALTNVRKHAPGAAVDVALRVDAAGTDVRVHDRPALRATAPSPVADSGGGYGLVGMRERAEALGGTVAAGPAPDGGWTVQLQLPGA